MNYFADPHDMVVMIAVVRRVLDVVAQWSRQRDIGPLMVPPSLAAKHEYVAGATPSDALLEDLAASLLDDRVPPDVDVPDGRRRGSPAPGERRRATCASRTPASCRTS